MSTRGFIGFVADGVEKIAYNHCDSYPEGVGLVVLRWLREVRDTGDLDGLAAAVRDLRVVRVDSTATAEEVGRYERYAHPMGAGPVDDWYRLLRRTQGDPTLILEAGVIVDASGFPNDPANKWGYVVDADVDVLEVCHGPGRCAILGSWDFDLLPTDSEFLAALAETVTA